MPLLVLNWWKGQKQILFYNVTVSGLDDIHLVLEKSQQLELPPNLAEAIDRTSLQQVLGRVMQAQKYLYNQGSRINLYTTTRMDEYRTG